MADIQTAYEVFRHLRVGTSAATLRAAVQAWRVAHVQAGHTEYADPLTDDATPITAYINHGRWLVDCTCGNGVPVTPWRRLRLAVCVSCGTVWTTVIVPSEAEDIEAALAVRRWRHTQNWRPGEALEQLQQENLNNPRGVR